MRAAALLFALALASLALVPAADAAKKKDKTTSTPSNSQCLAACQTGFTRCNVSGRDKNGNRATPVDCQRQLSECQTILCAPR